MSINPDRWTLKTQEAFSSAVERARSANNPEVTPDHVLAAVLDQADGIAGPVLTRVGVEPAVVAERDRRRPRPPAPQRGRLRAGDRPRVCAMC